MSPQAPLDNSPTQLALAQLSQDGFALLRNVFAAGEVAMLLSGLTAALLGDSSDAPSAEALANDDTVERVIRSRAGVVYAARNVLELYSAAGNVWRRGPLVELLGAALGNEFGLVRVLYFDKPPERTWSLPWHKDLTIAVRDNRLPSVQFTKPTNKAGVPHVEAPLALLERMLTLRIHLDDVTDDNGPLRVIAGSHHSGKAPSTGEQAVNSVLCAAGDVLAMRPLVSHSSPNSTPGANQHRRILHFEFAGQRELADGYVWHEFAPS